LQTTYTVRFNARHRRRGHLFQGRFKAELVEADAYGQWLIEYVHLNPVRPRAKTAPVPAERAGELAQYRWSSHRAYAGLARRGPAWLCLDWLAYWGRPRRAAQRGYRERMRAAFGKRVSNPWAGLRRGLVLGGEELLRRSEAILAQKGGEAEARWTQVGATERRRERVRKLIVGEVAAVGIWARVRLGQERGVDVAREVGYAHSCGLTMLIRRLEERAGRDPGLRRTLERLRRKAVCEL